MKKTYNLGMDEPHVRPKLTRLSNNVKTNQKGITIIALILTIVVMLILTSVTIYVGTDSIEYSKMVKFVTYMQTIQKKVDQIVENGNYNQYGEDTTAEQQQILQEILFIEESTSNVADFKYFDSSTVSEQLEIDDSEDEIVINFITREVFSLTGIEYEDKIYYSQYNLPGGQTLATHEITTRNYSMENVEITVNIQGLNATFKIGNDENVEKCIGITNGSLYYGKDYVEDEQTIRKWTAITNYTTEGEVIITNNIKESGIYYFKLVDNVTGNESISSAINLRLTNSPKLKGDLGDVSTIYNYSNLSASENWAYATDSETSIIYVWIPRFAYKTEDPTNIEFLRGTSDVTSSGGYIDANWTIPSQFTEEGTELTGVWVQVNSANQTEIDIIEILGTGTIL